MLFSEPDERHGLTQILSSPREQDLRGHRTYCDNKKQSWILNMFKNKAKNGLIILHPLFDYQRTHTLFTEDCPLTFSRTHKIIVT